MVESELPPVHIKKEPVVNPLLSSSAAPAVSGAAGLQLPTSANPLLPSVPLKRTASEAGLNTEPPQMPIIPSGGQLPQTQKVASLVPLRDYVEDVGGHVEKPF